MPELYSERDAETKVIVPKLRELGYHENGGEHEVALRFNHPITAAQGRERRTIYADILVEVRGSPVIVIDAKNPRNHLTENDREQVISYARLVGDIAPYAALCNGHAWQIFDTVTKQQLPHLPSYDDLLRDIQQRRVTTRQRRNLRSQATRTLFAIDSARELSRLMRRCHDVIRNLRGYDPTKAFDELSKLLFAKMYEEREVAEGRRDTNRFTTTVIEEMRREGVEIIETLWQDTVTSDRYREVFSEGDADGGIELPPEAIDEIVRILEEKSLGLTDLDVKGVAFEEFLAATYRGGGLGQYFTPREVVNFMVDLVDPAIGETVIDPACGTGGFLIRTYDVVSEKIRNTDFGENEKQRRLDDLANSCLVGIDWETRAARTCKMNMIIHGDGHSGVYQANGLDLEEIAAKVDHRRRHNPDAPDVEEGTFDMVLTNPPFGARDRQDEILDQFELGRGASQKREVLLLERCIRLLRPGGRLAVVIPEGILSNKNDDRIRNFIRDQCLIRAVIRLPQDAFKMSEGAACTSILYAVKKDPENPELGEQDDIFFARAEYIGITPSGQPINENDLLSIKEQFRRFDEGDWDGIELRTVEGERLDVVREEPEEEGDDLWLEPEVNRTSLLYDRLSYVVRDPDLQDRFSYTYFHPRYYRILDELDEMTVDVERLEDICVGNYPNRGTKPSEESAEGIPVLKVRNITGDGIDLETEYAPDTDEIREACERAIVEEGDVLITSTGEGTIGRVDTYPYEDIAFADGHICICRVVDRVSPRYLREYLRSEHGQIQMLRHVSGSTGQTELLQGHVKDLLIPIPARGTQDQIVEIMAEAREEARDLREEIERLRAQSNQIVAEARQEMVETLIGGP